MVSPHYHVIFRTCDVVKAVHGSRPFDLDKKTLIKVSFLSLYESLKNFSYSIHILGDKLSQEMQTFFQHFIELDRSITISNGDYGNDESLRQSFHKAMARPDDDWIYLCEDDYLHRPEAFPWIDELLRSQERILDYRPRRWWWKLLAGTLPSKPLFVHPADYPDRYEPDQRRTSFVFLSRFNHWRQISGTTFTFLARVSTLKKFTKEYFASSTGARDDYWSRQVYGGGLLLGKALCLSPIPGVATHLAEGVLTPLYDWRSLLEHYRVRLSDLRL